MKRLERLELLLWIAVPMGGLLATACGGSRGAEPDEIQGHLDEVVVPIVDDTALAFEFLADSTMLERVGTSLETSGAAGAWSDPEADPMPEPEPEPVDPNEPTAGEQLAEFLRETIFTEDNYEGDGVYRVRGEDVCPREVMEPAPWPPDGEAPEPDPEPQVDEECVQMVADLELKVEVLIVDSGYDASLLVGPRRSKPVKLELRGDSITVVVDLGAARAAIEHAANVTGQEVELSDVLEGMVAAAVRRDGEQAATVSVAIREAVSFQMTTEDGPISVEAAATEPLARISIDAIARHLEIQSNAGPVLAELPWELLESDTEIGGTLRVDLAGATGTIVVDDASESVTLEGLSLGGAESRISLDDQTIFAIDVTAGDGRAFDLTATPTDRGTTLAFDPGLRVVATIDERPILEVWDELDPAADGDTYELELDGESPTLEMLDGDDDTAGAVRVASGRLSLSENGEAVTVDAGQCLVESDVLDGEHPVLGAFESAACP